MKHPLTIGFTTSRTEPKFGWFFDSLKNQVKEGEDVRVIVVDYLAGKRAGLMIENGSLPALAREHFKTKHLPCKPTFWQGVYQLPREPWWAKSAYLNTLICLCETEWVAFTDDRAVLGPDWLQSIRHAMDENYAVCGSYEKRANMEVKDGEAIGGELLGVDTRRPGVYDFDSWYGGSGALPLEWCLMVNGVPEVCDSLGSEDSMFGVLLRNNGLPVKYDSRMRIIEDRTPGQIDGALKRADKNPHLDQQAKSWAIVRMFKDKLTSQNPFDIRNMRDRILAGEPFPPPTGSHFDFYDQQPISEME